MSPRSTLSLLSMMCAAQVGGYTGYVALPFTTGVLIDELGMDPAAAGLLGSLELGAMALTVLTMAPRVARLSLGRVALTGAAITIVAQGFAAFATDFLQFALLRVVAGFGEGLLASITGPLLATAATPERMSSMVAMVGALIYAVMLALVPVALTAAGRSGAFLALAGFVVLLVPWLARVPREPLGVRKDGEAPSRFPARAPVFCLLAGGVLIGISEAGVWSLDQRFASRVGMSEQELGLVLGLAGILSLAGAGLVAWHATGADGTARGRRDQPGRVALRDRHCGFVAGVDREPLRRELRDLHVVAPRLWHRRRIGQRGTRRAGVRRRHAGGTSAGTRGGGGAARAFFVRGSGGRRAEPGRRGPHGIRLCRAPRQCVALRADHTRKRLAGA